MNNGEYKEVQKFDVQTVMNDLDSGGVQRIVNALLGLAFHDEDWKRVQDLCIQYSNHPHYNVKGIAILCFGHLARIHGKLETEKVLPIVKKALHDSNDFVSGHANSALDDIQFFVK